MRWSLSFFGAATIRTAGLDTWGWAALAALLAGLVFAAILLAPWRAQVRPAMRRVLYGGVVRRGRRGTLLPGRSGWLASAGSGYQALREENVPKVQRMSRLSGALSVAMVIQTLSWLVDLVR